MTGTIYQGYALDAEGDVIVGASVEVRDQDSNSVVTIWSNRATTTTKTNPTTTDSNGYFFFYRTAGRYKITVTKDAFTSVFNNVSLGNAQELDTGTSAGNLVLYDDFGAVAFSNSYDDLDDLPTLGTMAALDSGTGGANFRTNSQNDTRFLKAANNLNDVTASSARANLDLTNIYSLEGVVANGYVPLKQAGAFVDSTIAIDGNGAATFEGNGPTTFNHDVDVTGAFSSATVNTGQGDNELYAMDQDVQTTDSVTFGPITSNTSVHTQRTTGDLDTTGVSYFSIQDNSTGSYVERGWFGFGAGDGSFDVKNSTAGELHLSNSGGRKLSTTSTGVDVTGAIAATTGMTPAASQDAITIWKNRTLDDSLVPSGSSGSAGTFAADLYRVEYERHGNDVYVNGLLFNVTNKGSWGGDVLLPLPFACVCNGSVNPYGSVKTEHHTFTGSPTVETSNGVSYLRVRLAASAGGSSTLQWSGISTTSNNEIRFSLVYPTA